MDEKPRILEIAVLDSLPSELVSETVAFFNTNFPGNLAKGMTTKFFTSKLGSSNPNGFGFLTVAMFDKEVVGSCSATRKRLVVDLEVVEAIEIGDTFTSQNFRKNCAFNKRYANTEGSEEYLNKSIFGRLATETLDRATAHEISYVYGTPNLQAKLSWLKRMNFKLVDYGYTYRISSASKSHPVYNKSKIISVISKLYLEITKRICKFSIRKYTIEIMQNCKKLELEFDKCLIPPSGSISILNYKEWIESRFLENDDKKYEVVRILSKSDKSVSGYLFFLKQTRTDGFDLMILSKALFSSEKLSRLKLQFARISCEKFFEYQNLSLWTDSRLTKLSTKFMYGFLSKKTRVDIVGRGLTEQGKKLINRNFFNFDYGDSDLG